MVGAIDDESKKSCGAAAIRIYGEQAGLISLFVAESCRRKAHGRNLIETCVKACKLGELPTLCAVVDKKEGDEATEKLLCSLDFEIVNISEICSAPIKELRKNKKLIKAGESGGIISFANLPASMIYAFNRKTENDIEFIFEPINRGKIDLKYSTAIGKDGQISGGIWVSEHDGEYYIDGLYVTRSSRHKLAAAIGRTLSSAAGLPEETVINFLPVNELLNSIVDRLFQGVDFNKQTTLTLERKIEIPLNLGD